MLKKLRKTLGELDAILANFEKDMVDFDKSMKDFNCIMSDLDGICGESHPNKRNINLEDLLELDPHIKWDD